jgi:hypothetical protein
MHQGEMPPSEVPFHVEGPTESLLSSSAREEIVSTNDVRHSLAVIVDDDGELIRGAAGLCPDDHVADLLGGVESSLAPKFVLDGLKSGLDEKAVIAFLIVEMKGSRVIRAKGRGEDHGATALRGADGLSDLAATEAG